MLRKPNIVKPKPAILDPQQPILTTVPDKLEAPAASLDPIGPDSSKFNNNLTNIPIPQVNKSISCIHKTGQPDNNIGAIWAAVNSAGAAGAGYIVW